MELLPGTLISVYDLSDMLNVSRTPIREALIQLSWESLITVLPQRKTMVSLINLERVSQECFLRKALEYSIIPQFLNRCTNEHIVALEKINARLVDTLREGNVIEGLEMDDALHRVSFIVAKQSLSWNTIVQMNGHYRRMRNLILRDADYMEKTINDHQLVIEAFKNRDAETARRILDDHCIIPPMKEKCPEFFE